MLAHRSHEFGTVLKRLRVEAGLSQEQLAQRARISVQAVGAYERGTRRAPYRETLRLLLEALNAGRDAREELIAAAERGRLRGPVSSTPPRHNLPCRLSRLIGRDRVLAEIQALIGEARLVAIVGTGGIGKTRAAIQVASNIVDEFPDGVWFVDLAALDDARLITGSVAFTLRIAQEPDRPVLESLLHAIENSRLLLLLDNCEHMIAAASQLADTVLRRAPNLKVLMTSRETPHVPGARVYRIPPLDVPPAGASSALDAARYGAVALFAEAARALDQSFTLSDENAPIVAELCRRLDGIPLAIELAARRTTVLALPELNRRIHDRQTLHAVMEWSYELLTAEEQEFFRRLAVFSGGWSLEGAAAFCDNAAVIELLGSLVDKSLVIARAGSGRARYHLLETTRAFALEQLESAGERSVTARRHAEFVARFVADSRSITEYDRRVALLQSEIENIRSALRWSVANEKATAIAARILHSAGDFLSQNFRTELVDQLKEVLRRSDGLDDELHGEMWILLALATVGTDALEAASRAVAVLEQAHLKTVTLVKAHQLRSYALAQLKRTAEALEANRRAVETYDEIGADDRDTLGLIYFQHAYLLNYDLQLPQARAAWNRARELAERVRDGDHVAKALCNIAETYYLEGDLENAQRIGSECLERCRQDGLVYLEAHTLNNMASYRLQTGDVRGAASDAAAAAETARRAGDDGVMIARAIGHCAMVSALESDYRAAAELLGYSNAYFQARGYHDPSDERQSERLKSLLADHVDAEDLQRLTAGGAALDADEAWDLAHAVIAQTLARPPL